LKAHPAMASFSEHTSIPFSTDDEALRDLEYKGEIAATEWRNRPDSGPGWPARSDFFERFQEALDPDEIFAPSLRLVSRDPIANFGRSPVPVGKHANVGKPA